MNSRSTPSAKVVPGTKKLAPTRSTVKDGFLVVAIGASAGGFESFTELLKYLPVKSGLALVLIQHLDPKHPSMLTELLAKATAMEVEEVKDGTTVRPNHVYVIPPNVSMSIRGYSLRLAPREDSHSAPMPIDGFMRSLAEQLGARAIGVVLSGLGSDGTRGLAEIQAQGGVTFAQQESTARYAGMPHNAIMDGHADYVLPLKEIAQELARIAQHPYVTRGDRSVAPTNDASSLERIFLLVRKATGLDFTHYRQATILRRIQRRMVVNKVDSPADYFAYLRGNAAEIKALYQDMLINVTSFFRNPRLFEAMKSRIFPAIFKHEGFAPVRIWTPACASGEETYSLAISLLEYFDSNASHVPVQIFGTDVSAANIEKAREGIYSQNLQSDVSSERLRRFFTTVDGNCHISKEIRGMCIFAQQDLLGDPPFSQMDLICCRNLLIYLEPVLQKKAISLFHCALRPAGFLVLGSSEGVGGAPNLVSTEDRSLRIFLRKLRRHPSRSSSP